MFPYLKLLIKQRIAMWSPARNLRSGKSKGKVIFSYIGFGVGMLSLYGMLVGLEYLMYGAFAQLGEPQTMLAITGVLCTVMVVITGFFYILSELFFSKDVVYVSSLPISSRGLLAAKLTRIWIGEAGIAMLICLPVVVLYGVGNAMNVWFYLKALLLIPFMSMVPLAVVTLLSFALIRLSALWKRREMLTIFISMAFLIGFMYVEMMFSMSAEDGDISVMMLQLVLRQKPVIDLIIGLYPPIGWFTAAVTQQGGAALLNGLTFMLLNVGAVAALVLLLGGTYQRLAVKQSEALARMNATAKQRVDRHGMRTPLRALYRREMREILSVPIYAMNSLAAAVMFPVITVAMMMSAGNGSNELSLLPMMIGMVPKPLAVAIAIAVFAFTTSMNMAVSTAVSREGKRHEFFRTLPVAPQTQMFSKLLMGLTINLICALPIAVILFVMLPALRLQIVIGFAASLLFSVATAATALMIDAAHPRFGWKTETEAIKQNGIAAMSMFGSMAFVAVCGGAFYGLTLLHVSATGAILILCGLMLLTDVLLLRRLFGKASQTYILQEMSN